MRSFFYSLLVVSVFGLICGAGNARAELPRRKKDTAPPSVVIPAPSGAAEDHDHHHEVPAPEMDPAARPAEFDRSLFSPDPVYDDKPYDPEAQYAIYGGKSAVDAPRPPIEWGYPMYQAGPIGPGLTIFGEKNLARPQLLVYGDMRMATAYNDNGATDTAQSAVRLNLDVDARITATERFHAFFRPFDRVRQGGRTSRIEYGGNRSTIGDESSEFIFDADPEALFFEGDLGQIWAGASGEYNSYDLPFTVGLVPLFFQNGIWMEDAFWGGAFTIPALNSSSLDISNMDFTFFAGFDRVTTGALLEDNRGFDDHGAKVFGIAGFIERHEAYIEVGYGYTDDQRSGDGGNFGYHNFTASSTQRFGGFLSNSVRVIANVGQDPDDDRQKTADGWLFLLENSLIGSKPYTVIPYFNLFAGIDSPQSLARDFGAGGVLKNTGINFDTDGVTGFPTLDPTAGHTYGGAFGIQYLFNLDQQLVFELAGLRPFDGDNEPDRAAQGDQLAFGTRYQVPLSKQWIFRTDAIYGIRENDDDVAGVRAEFRIKF